MIAERCGCGARIKAWRWRQVQEWRTAHLHIIPLEPEEEAEPQESMAFTETERAPRDGFDGWHDTASRPTVTMRHPVGFTAS